MIRGTRLFDSGIFDMARLVAVVTFDLVSEQEYTTCYLKV